MKFKKTWSEFKAAYIDWKVPIHYEDNGDHYYLWMDAGIRYYSCIVHKDGDTPQTEFETFYKPISDTQQKFYRTVTPDGLTRIVIDKDYTTNETQRVTYNFADKRTWWQNSTAMTAQTCTHIASYTEYALPSQDAISKDLITDRDILSGYEITVYKNGTEVTNYTLDHKGYGDTNNLRIVFDTPNIVSDVITADYYEAGSSEFMYYPDPSKVFKVKLFEMQFSVGCDFNDVFVLQPVVNNPTTSGTDYYVPGSETTIFSAQDILNKFNLATEIQAFGELTKNVIQIPLGHLTYKVLAPGTELTGAKEFNKLSIRLKNDQPVTNADFATMTIYADEYDL